LIELALFSVQTLQYKIISNARLCITVATRLNSTNNLIPEIDGKSVSMIQTTYHSHAQTTYPTTQARASLPHGDTAKTLVAAHVNS
jgi:hypothetical protein